MLRRARPDDVEAIVTIFRTSRAEAMPWLPVVHTAGEDRWYFGEICLPQQEVWVEEIDGRVAGFAALENEVLTALYVAPDLQRRGVGDALFDETKRLRPDGFRFWVFQRNERARRFYENRGARLVDLTDGSGNDEREPDALYEWRP